MSPSPLWFVDRSSGEVTLLLMTLVLALGIVRSAMPRLNPVLVEGLHGNIALLTIAFAAAHIVASVADPFARLTVIDATVPFGSEYRRTWLGLGVVSAYLYVVAVLTSWPARRLSRGAWLWIHRCLYGAWGVALLHSLGTGSDARNQVFLMLDLAAVVAVVAVFLGVRVAEAWPSRPVLWTGVAVATVAALVALGAWTVSGPLQAGWASSSGTPPDLLQK